MSAAEEIVTDADIDAVWGNASFGTATRREVVDRTVLKYACGYISGHTATMIVRDLGLISVDPYERKSWLTKKGQLYLYAAYYGRNKA